MENTDVILQTCENISNELAIMNKSIVNNTIGGEIEKNNSFTETVKNNYSHYITQIGVFLSIDSKYVPILLLLLFLIIIGITYYIYNKYFKQSDISILSIEKYNDNNKTENTNNTTYSNNELNETEKSNTNNSE